MSRKHSTRSRPDKPYPTFPLFPHATRRWAKKIRGKMHYFGPWDDPDGALQKYLDQKDDLHAGRTPRAITGELTIRDLVNHFLTSKKLLKDSGELAARTWADYDATCGRLVSAFGVNRIVADLSTADFDKYRAALAERWGPVALGNEVQRVRTVFKWGFDSGLIEAPVRFGPAFKKPSKKIVRQARREKGPRMFEAAELRKIINAAEQPLKAMILLGVNCAFGNTDCATLPTMAIDLKAGWVTHARPKTGIDRRAKLWPETSKALGQAIKDRPAPKDAADVGLAFITKYGDSWKKETADNPLSKEMAKLLKELKLHRGNGLGFYALRHTFETIAGESKDQPAVDHVMGHARDDMASVYRERISDERLAAVAEHVRGWLFGAEKGKAARKNKPAGDGGATTRKKTQKSRGKAVR